MGNIARRPGAGATLLPHFRFTAEGGAYLYASESGGLFRMDDGVRDALSALASRRGGCRGGRGSSSRSPRERAFSDSGRGRGRRCADRASPPASPYARADADVLLQPRMPLLLRGPGGRMRFPGAGGRNSGGDVPGVAPGERRVPARPLRGNTGKCPSSSSEGSRSSGSPSCGPRFTRPARWPRQRGRRSPSPSPPTARF